MAKIIANRVSSSRHNVNFVCVLGLAFLTMFTSVAKAEMRIGYFAGGCFWCTEADFEKLDGVISVISGFMGGTEENPAYELVASGLTGHRETVAVEYDSDKISYQQLLDAFWQMHDPTDGTGSFVDRGYQYSSAVYYQTEDEKELALADIQRLNLSQRYARPIMTVVEPAKAFYPAEDKHQDYYKKHAIKYNYYRYRSGRDEHILQYWPEKSAKP